MFERYTEAARLVVIHAQEEARVLRSAQIGTGHLLLGVLRAVPLLLPLRAAPRSSAGSTLRGCATRRCAT
jgi:Clp amino terminal domain, pathogenicity island component